MDDEEQPGNKCNPACFCFQGGSDQKGRVETQDNEVINEDRIRDMNRKVDDMITGHMKTVDLVIQRKGQIPKPPRSGRGPGVSKASNCSIFDDVADIVKNERNGERIRIRRETEKDDYEKMNEAPMCRKENLKDFFFYSGRSYTKSIHCRLLCSYLHHCATITGRLKAHNHIFTCLSLRFQRPTWIRSNK